MRAEVRRASSTTEIMMTTAFGRLLSRVSYEGKLPSASVIEALANVVMVAVHIPHLNFEAPSIGKLMATPMDGRPIISALRCKTLLRSPNAAEAAMRLRPLVVLMESRLGRGLRASPRDLLQAMESWDERKLVWAMGYHSSGDAPRLISAPFGHGMSTAAVQHTLEAHRRESGITSQNGN